MNYEAMQQMARILGRKELALALGIPAGKMPAELTAEQRVSLARLVDGRIDDLVRGMLEEAAACDDVVNAGTAISYLEYRLEDLAEVLNEDQRHLIRSRFEGHVSGWG